MTALEAMQKAMQKAGLEVQLAMKENKEELRMVDSLVNAATLAAKLGQAKSSIYRLAQAGLIPSYAAGPRLRGRRFDIVEVRDALKALAQQAMKP